jgi:hypothetical protein
MSESFPLHIRLGALLHEEFYISGSTTITES